MVIVLGGCFYMANGGAENLDTACMIMSKPAEGYIIIYNYTYVYQY